MILIFAGAIILGLCGASLVVIGRHIPAVALVGEEELARVHGDIPLYRKILGFVKAEQRALLLKMMLKLVHRMRMISLRADSASGKLIDRLRTEHRSSEEEARDAVETRQEAFVNKLLEQNYERDASKVRVPLAGIKSRKKRTVVK